MADVSVPRPGPDQVLLLVCDDDAFARTTVHRDALRDALAGNSILGRLVESLEEDLDEARANG